MKNQVGTISLKPTAEGYARMLIQILRTSDSVESISFATEEITKVFTAASHGGVFDAESEVPNPNEDGE